MRTPALSRGRRAVTFAAIVLTFFLVLHPITVRADDDSIHCRVMTYFEDKTIAAGRAITRAAHSVWGALVDWAEGPVDSDRAMTLKLNRPLDGLEAGSYPVTFHLHGRSDKERELHLMVKIGDTTKDVAVFQAGQLGYHAVLEQNPVAPTEMIAKDKFDARAGNGLTLKGEVVQTYAMRYDDHDNAVNAWRYRSSFVLADSAGALGSLSGNEVVDWGWFGN